jgi:hypothetical protein
MNSGSTLTFAEDQIVLSKTNEEKLAALRERSVPIYVRDESWC